jgi:hypothetical protein
MSPPASRDNAQLGVRMVAVGAVAFVLLLSRAGLEPVNLGRMAVVLGLCYLVTRGRHWASVLLAIFSLVGGASLLLSAFRLGIGSVGGAMCLVGAVLYAGGYILLWRAGGSGAFLQAPAA